MIILFDTTMMQQTIPCCSYTSVGYEPNAALIESSSLMQNIKSSESAAAASKASSSSDNNSVLSGYSSSSSSRLYNYYSNPNKRIRTYSTNFAVAGISQPYSIARRLPSPPGPGEPVPQPITLDPSIIEEQRRRIRSPHFARNNWVRPAVHRLTLIQDYLSDLRTIEENKTEIERLQALQSEERAKIYKKLEDLIAIQLEETKGKALSQYTDLLQDSLFGNTQLTATQAFDSAGKALDHSDLVEVENPYSGGVYQGRIVQVVDNNIVLVRLSETEKIVAKFGSETRLLPDI